MPVVGVDVVDVVVEVEVPPEPDVDDVEPEVEVDVEIDPDVEVEVEVEVENSYAPISGGFARGFPFASYVLPDHAVPVPMAGDEDCR